MNNEGECLLTGLGNRGVKSRDIKIGPNGQVVAIESTSGGSVCRYNNPRDLPAIPVQREEDRVPLEVQQRVEALLKDYSEQFEKLREGSSAFRERLEREISDSLMKAVNSHMEKHLRSQQQEITTLREEVTELRRMLFQRVPSVTASPVVASTPVAAPAATSVSPIATSVSPVVASTPVATPVATPIATSASPPQLPTEQVVTSPKYSVPYFDSVASKVEGDKCAYLGKRIQVLCTLRQKPSLPCKLYLLGDEKVDFKVESRKLSVNCKDVKKEIKLNPMLRQVDTRIYFEFEELPELEYPASFTFMGEV